jgi:inner membrane protein
VIIFDSYFEHLVFAGVGLDYLILDFMISEMVLFYPALLLGALYPDIDHPGSFLGKRFDFISKLINEIYGHRTITHSLFLMTVIFFIAVLFWGVHPALTGFTVGFLSHFLGDLTNGRVQLLYPLQKKKFGLNSISVKHLKQK